MNIDEAKNKLSLLQAKMSAYQHALELLYYDGATTAPKGTASNRAHTYSILSEELYNLSTGEDTVLLLDFLNEHRGVLSEKEKREVFLLSKNTYMMKKVPLNEYTEYQMLLVEADDVWHTAKENSDFALFEPFLQRIFDTNRKFAGYFAPGKDPYDYWLNEYEEGLSKSVCDAFFGKLKARLVPLIEKIKQSAPVDDSFLYGDFPEDKQAELSEYILNIMQTDRSHLSLSTTEHPFTTSLGSHLDERITTHYYRENFASSMYSVIHEAGHALYDMGSDESLAYTVLDGGVSMGIHESQSRFYENILGRSREFIYLIYPKLAELFPSISNHSPEELYRALNKAEPSLIRTEADEVTYSLHVMIRYELEKRVMAGELAVHDLPAEWNRLYKEYLGVDVPDDRHGVLQDSHWSGGAIGYFPSYALGSAYGAQFLREMQKNINVVKCMADGDFIPVNEWGKENIWKCGHLFTPPELLGKVLGEPFDPDIYLDYLENKMKDIYKL